jgi:CHAT domain-containing protein
MNLSLSHLIEQLIHADTWSEARELIEQYPQLLDESVEELMTTLLVQRQNDSVRLQRFRETQRLLQRCRQEGIETAFAQPNLPPELNAILSTLTHSLTPLDRTEKLALAQRGLSMVNQANSPRIWAVLQMYSANAVSVDTSSQRDQSQEQAIHLYQDILPVLLTQDMMVEYASVSSNLAHVYVERIQGERRQNLQAAIHYYLQALHYQSLDRFPIEHATTLSDLANAYHLLKQLDQRAIIESDYEQFDDILKSCLNYLLQDTLKEKPSIAATVAASLGGAFFFRLAGKRSENLEQSIKLYQRALTHINPITDTIRWGSVQSDLGLVLLQREAGDRSDNLEQAKLALEQALTVRTRELQPWDWAISMMNLAKVWTQRIVGDRQANLVQAIDAYQQVLTLVNPQNSPALWGQVMNDLGLTYLQQQACNPEYYVELAIQSLQKSLHVRPRLRSPQAWAETLDNLATAYLWRIKLSRTSNIEQAISLYQQVLTVRNRNSVPEMWAETMSHLGDAYFIRLRGRAVDNMEQAIRCYQGALTIYHYETHPQDWCSLRYRLGTAYMRRKEGQCDANLITAIDYFQQILSLSRLEDTPINCADTLNNLGLAYAELSHYQTDQFHLLAKAEQCLKQSLEIYSLTRTPLEYQISQNNLAYIYFCQNAWTSAWLAYQAGLMATLQLEQSALIPPTLPFLLSANMRPSAGAAYTLAQMGELGTALEILEQSEQRLFNHSLQSQQRQLAELKQTDQQALNALRNRIALLEQESRRLDRTNNHNFQRLDYSLNTARQQLSELMTEIKKQVPEFLPSHLNSFDIKCLSRLIQQPIVYLTVTYRGGLALIILPDETLHVCWLPNLLETELLKWVNDQDEVRHYLHGLVLNHPALLEKSLNQLLPLIKDNALEPIHLALQPLNYAQAVLVSSGVFSLLSLSTALTDLVISRLPYSGLLPNLLKAKTQEENAPAKLLGVAEPLPLRHLLHFTTLELEQIRPLFAAEQQQVLAHALANRALIRKAMPNANYLHFGCYAQAPLDNILATRLYLAADTAITLHELLNDGLLANKRLFVLSSCQNSSHQFTELGCELKTVADGLLLGGVAGVLVSLWAANDISTALLIKRFYQLHCVEQLPPAVALHQAQQWLRNATVTELELVRYMESVCRQSGHSDSQLLQHLRRYRNHPQLKPFISPYFWAGFAFYGL